MIDIFGSVVVVILVLVALGGMASLQAELWRRDDANL